MDVEGPVRVCPRDVPHAATGPGGASPLAAVRYATQSAEDDAATGERISAAFGGPGGKSPGHISVVVAHSRSELEYARRVLREAAARRAGFAPDSGAAATASYVVAPPREEEAGEIMTGLHVQLRDMSNPAYDGLNGVVVGPLDDGAWAVMPSDTRRALSLRALARATERQKRGAFDGHSEAARFRSRQSEVPSKACGGEIVPFVATLRSPKQARGQVRREPVKGRQAPEQRPAQAPRGVRAEHPAHRRRGPRADSSISRLVDGRA